MYSQYDKIATNDRCHTSIPIASAALDLPTMLAKIYAELLAQRAVFRSLNPYAHNSALVEDALGWTFQMPLELVVSWNVSRLLTS